MGLGSGLGLGVRIGVGVRIRVRARVKIGVRIRVSGQGQWSGPGLEFVSLLEEREGTSEADPRASCTRVHWSATSADALEMNSV